MKQFSVILNLVLLVAVGYLYFLHYRDANSPGGSGITVSRALPMGGGRIVFLNSDSLLDKYEFYESRKMELEEKQNKMREELRSENERLQKDIEQYQSGAAGLSEQQRQKREEELMTRQQQLMQKKDVLSGQLEEEQGKAADELYSRLSSYLKTWNKGKNYDFILGVQRGSGVLFANDSLDITTAILDGLNKEFGAEKK